MTIGGILTAMVTPFGEDGAVDEGATSALIHYLLENGSDGLVVTGTTGESPTLSDDEMAELWRLAVAECGDATVIAGTGSNDTRHAIELTERATEAGVDAVLVVTPYYNKPNRAGLKAHFKAVAAATDLPVVLYNIPSRSIVDMPNDLVAELAAEVPNVRAIKQASYDQLAPVDGVDLLAGNDDVLAKVLDMGGTGGILVASHLVGREMRRMIDEPDARHEIDAALKGVFRAMAVAPSPAPVKAGLELLGHPVGGVRLPLVEVTDDEKAVVREALEAAGVLSRV